MPINAAGRINRVQAPATTSAGERARELERQGVDVIDLGQSSPHYVTPDHIVEAGVKALRDGLTNVSFVRGMPEFVEAMARKLAEHNRITVQSERDILVTPGSKQGLYDVINGYIGPGDEVLLIEPTWVSFSQQIELAGGVSVGVALDVESEYSLSYEILKSHTTSRTKAIVVNNPNNPTGRVYTEAELRDVSRLAQEFNLLVICDETYEYFLYDGRKHISIASLPGMWERTVTSFTFTKAYAMAGWRLGCLVGTSALLEPAVRVHDHTSSFVSPFVQMAGVAALNGVQNHVAAWREECDELRLKVAERLNKVSGINCAVPQGATFVFPRYTANLASVDIAKLLIDRAQVVVTPGVGFGRSAEQHLRIALMRSPADRVIQGVERVANVLEGIG